MIWINNKNESGWNPIWISNRNRNKIAMEILFPQSKTIYMEMFTRGLKRIKLGLSDETPEKLIRIFDSMIENELTNRLTGLSQAKKHEMSMKRIAKISKGIYYDTCLKKESFINIWERPDIYRIIDWDITAPWDSDKQEYISEKAKYSISYEQFRNIKGREVFKLELYPWDKRRKKEITLTHCFDNQYMIKENLSSVKKYPGIEITKDNRVKLTAINFDLKPLK